MKCSKTVLRAAFALICWGNVCLNNGIAIAQQSPLSQLEQCWQATRRVVVKETMYVGKAKNCHVSWVRCEGDSLQKAVEIEYRLLLSNNRFDNDDQRYNHNPQTYETRTAYIDEDELPDLIAGLRALTQNILNSPRQQPTEVRFVTRCGLQIFASFNVKSERWNVYIEFADRKRNNIQRDVLTDLLQLLLKAQGEMTDAE